MKFYTSYFYQIRNFPKNLVGLSTAIYPPKYINFNIPDKRGVIIIDCPPLKPGIKCEGLCNGSCHPKHPQDCAFLKTYKQQLDEEITPNFFNKLNELAAAIKEGEHLDEVNFAFIVFEAPSNPCSERIVIQQWFKEHNINIEEWHR